MKIPWIRLPVLPFRRPSRPLLIVIVLAIALPAIAVFAWFTLLPQLGIIPKDLVVRDRIPANLTVHSGRASNLLTAPLAQPLIADFYAVLVHPDDPSTFQFLDLSRGSPGRWYWDFGDGTSATDEHPIHHFSSTGDVPVTLTVTRDDGASCTVTRSGFLLAASPGKVRVRLDTNRPGIVSKGSSVSFRTNDSRSSIVVGGSNIGLPYGALVRLRLNRDSEGSLATRSGQLPGVMFPDATLYIDGNQAARGPVGQVSLRNPAWLSTEMNLTVRPVSGDIRQFMVNGTALMTGLHNANIRIRHLDLFPETDLTLESSPAYFDGTALSYQFVPDVIAGFEPADTVVGGAPFHVTFTDMSAGSPQSWLWDFGDGTTSSEQNPRHTYDEAGSYTVKLTVRNGEIADSKKKDRLVVVTAPRVSADFSAGPVSGAAPLTVRFTDRSTGSPTSWQWDFGDNSTAVASTEQNPVHVYEEEGSYSVWLGVNNIFGSSDIYRQQYIVVGEPFRSPDKAVFLRAGRGGYLESGSTVRFTVAGSAGTISTGGDDYELPVGTDVQLVLTTDQYGTVSVTGGKMIRFDLADVAVYIDDQYIRTGRIDSIYIPGIDRFRTSLSCFMPPDTAWTQYTENGYEVLADLESRWIRISSIGMNKNGLLSLTATGNSTYIDGAAAMTEHDWIVE